VELDGQVSRASISLTAGVSICRAPRAEQFRSAAAMASASVERHRAVDDARAAVGVVGDLPGLRICPDEPPVGIHG
jgi:hypothetical protein